MGNYVVQKISEVFHDHFWGHVNDNFLKIQAGMTDSWSIDADKMQRKLNQAEWTAPEKAETFLKSNLPEKKVWAHGDNCKLTR